MTTKLSLRRLITSRLKALPPSEIQRQSSEIFHMLVSHDKFKEARLISLYLSTDLEIDTIRLLRYALEEANKRCFVPFIDPNGDRTRMSMVELKSMRHYDRLSTNGFGIKEMTSLVDDDNGPLSEASELDLMIVPGVAFSLDGRRLGHGKGYYDRYLWEWERKQLPSNKRLYTIGLAIREQLVDDPLAVPGQDYTLDEVLVAPRRD